MKVCALQWKTTGVAGLNSELVALYREGADRGDEWKVYETWPWSSFASKLFTERTLIRGGDVYLTVDGKLSHHPDYVEEVAAYINYTFDILYLSGFVPHPNKAYGDKPHFIELLKRIKIPIIGRICDGYVSSYREWFELGLEYADHVTIAYSYRSTVEQYGIPGVHIPFYPELISQNKTEDPSLVWLSQWKNIKGIKQFVKSLPDLNPDIQVDMYSNGIEYYNLRGTPMWQSAVGIDHFEPKFSGSGTANFYGYIPLENIPIILQRAWAMADFQGMGKARYEVYNRGSLNTTGIEALWYGCLPIVAHNSTIPDALCVKVQPDRIAKTINQVMTDKRFVLDPVRRDAAIDYVSEHFLANNLYDDLLGLYSSGVAS